MIDEKIILSVGAGMIDYFIVTILSNTILFVYSFVHTIWS